MENDRSIFDERNSVYQVRMNDFCASNHLTTATTTVTNVTQRPKCSISPINLSQADSFLAPPLPSYNTVLSPFAGPKTLYLSQIDANSSQHSYSSPFVPLAAKQQPLNKHLLSVVDQSLPKMMQFQSTPNRPEDLDLAKSSSSVAKKPKSRVNFHSIHELATSSNSNSSIDSSHSSANDNSNNSSGYASFSSIIQSRISNQSQDDEDKENGQNDVKIEVLIQQLLILI